MKNTQRVPKIEFLGGVVRRADVERLNTGAHPHVVFAGRSNVGKSSLLNALVGERIARVSAEPGKTREMNFFRWCTTRILRQAIVLVDLPGYGYAKVAGELRKQWGREITQWLREEERIGLVVVLADGRHGFMPNDLELINFLASGGIPFLVAFTKMDKWKSTNQRRVAERELSLVASKAGVADFVFVSTMQPKGTSALTARIREVLKGQQAVG